MIAAVIISAALTLLAAIDPDGLALVFHWRWRVQDVADPLLILVLCGVPLGVLFGSLLGSLPKLHLLSRDGRVLVLFVGSFTALAIALPQWATLGLFAIPVTLFHAAYIHRQIDPPPPLPVATVKKWSPRTAGPSRP